MNLETRLARHLKTTGEHLDGPSGDAARPIEIAGRRRRRRRFLGGAGALAAIVVVAGLGLGALTSGVDQEVVAVSEGRSAATPSTATTAAPAGRGDDGPDAVTPSASGLPASTGPTPGWSEVASQPQISTAEILWTGTYFVTVGFDSAGTGQLFRSADGITWTTAEGDLSGVLLWGLAGTGDSLVVWGGGPDQRSAPALEADFGVGVQQVMLSRDGGETWTGLGTGGTAESSSSSSPYLRRFDVIDHAAVSGDTVVVALSAWLDLDIERVLADRGPEGSVGYANYSVEHGDGNGGTVAVCLDSLCDDELRFSFAELGIDADDAGALSAGPVSSTRLLRSVGGEQLSEVAPLSESEVMIDIEPFGDGFVAAAIGEGGSSIHRSADGVSWDRVWTGVGELGPLAVDGETIFSPRWSNTGDSVLVRSDDGGATWSTVGGLGVDVDGVWAGPAGLAVTGRLPASGEVSEPPVPVVLDKDGFTVTGSEERLTVADADGEVILDYGPEELNAEEPPETVVVDEIEGGFTFLDPETSEPLLTLSSTDMQRLFGSAIGRPAERPETLVGWSGDGGATWGWQLTPDAFGVDGWVRLAVGDGVVVAAVDGYVDPTRDPDDAAAGPLARTHLFVATTE